MHRPVCPRNVNIRPPGLELQSAAQVLQSQDTSGIPYLRKSASRRSTFPGCPQDLCSATPLLPGFSEAWRPLAFRKCHTFFTPCGECAIRSPTHLWSWKIPNQKHRNILQRGTCLIVCGIKKKLCYVQWRPFLIKEAIKSIYGIIKGLSLILAPTNSYYRFSIIKSNPFYYYTNPTLYLGTFTVVLVCLNLSRRSFRISTCGVRHVLPSLEIFLYFYL